MRSGMEQHMKAVDISKHKQQPEPLVVERLEMLLEQAKAGEIRSMAYVVGYAETVTAGGFCIKYQSEAIYAIGEMERLKKRLLENL